jgi:hypothetical protein
MGSYSTFLFARPSYLSGVARTLDIGGSFNAYNESPDAQSADANALASDWKAVGEDLMAAANEWAREQGVGK